MCIRDSSYSSLDLDLVSGFYQIREIHPIYLTRFAIIERYAIDIYACLLYTSDAADERSSVDLGGRRIIKKKKSKKM